MPKRRTRQHKGYFIPHRLTPANKPYNSHLYSGETGEKYKQLKVDSTIECCLKCLKTTKFKDCVGVYYFVELKECMFIVDTDKLLNPSNLMRTNNQNVIKYIFNN